MGRIIVIAALVVLQLVFGAPAFLLKDGDYLLRAATYSFFHASWWHLAVNCLAIWGLLKPSRKQKWQVWALAYLIAFLVYPLSFRPAIGFSNILYAVIGLQTPPLSNRWWRTPTVIVFLAVTVALVFIPKFSATTHIAAFLLGCCFAAFHRAYLKLTQDARRYY